MMMSLTIERSPEAVTEISWRSPELNLWVATSNGEYAGMVEFLDGHFVARGRTGDVIDHLSSIPSAQKAVTDRALADAAAMPPASTITPRSARGIRRGLLGRQDAA
jgi:hypothetical protein